MSDETKLFCDRCGEELQQEACNHVRPCECMTKRISALESELAESRADNERLREIVGKLPTTADGVPVVPGSDDRVWRYCGHSMCRKVHSFGVDLHSQTSSFYCNDYDISTCYSTLESAIDAANKSDDYSTRAAAEAAKGGGK